MDQAEMLRNAVKLKKQVNKPNARVITVTSGKGGVGKSNVAVNLAVQMQRQGKRVLVFDADFGLANVEVMFGAIPKYNLGDVIYHGKRISEIISEGPLGIGFISGGTGITGLNNLSQEQVAYMIQSLNELDQLADVIIIDTGAGISNHVLEFVMASPEVLLITTPDPSSLTDSYSLLKALYKNPKFRRQETKVSVLANRVTSAGEGRHVYEKLQSVVTQFLQGEIFYAGMIPQDSALERAVRQQQPVSIYTPASKSARAFEMIASNILNNEQKQEKASLGISQLFSNFWKHND
ncbi:MAG: MinD/ParA family protein [Clostridiales bacterium]|nr:MinD/ParA family protein [Clostridiales bacterium]